jgi:lipid-binding SYLF domain-containing protein
LVCTPDRTTTKKPIKARSRWFWLDREWLVLCQPGGRLAGFGNIGRYSAGLGLGTELAFHQVMKTAMFGLVMLFGAISALGVDKAELDNRVYRLTAKFVEMQSSPEKRVPADLLHKAQGIVLLDRTKAGFLFAFQGGGGVAVVRDPKSGQWSPAAFLEANEASLGLQVGGEQNFFVILLMNTNATRMLTESKFEFGGEARGTGGDASEGVEGSLSSTEQPMVVYSARKGLYGGVAIKGGSITPDEDANYAYYLQWITMQDILFDKKAKVTDSVKALEAQIDKAAEAKTPTTVTSQ